MTKWCLPLLGTVLATQVAAGQRIMSGQRVRMTLTSDSIRTGVVDSLNQDRIWLRPARQSATPIPLSQVQRMELSQGRKPALGKGLAFGALSGAAVGGALWLAFISGDPYDENKGLWAAVFLGSGVVGGALAGAGLSLILARDRWEVVPRDRWAVGPAAWQLGFQLVP
jgi:hypothetical protein